MLNIILEKICLFIKLIKMRRLGLSSISSVFGIHRIPLQVLVELLPIAGREKIVSNPDRRLGRPQS